MIKIGVSAVHQGVMQDYWADMISPVQDLFDVPGKGYMVHPMWMKFNDVEWSDIRETSFNFGWRGYNERMKEWTQ